MELFDKKFVHFMWDDELEGKKGFFDDSINDLIDVVNDDPINNPYNNGYGTVVKSNNDDEPFLKKESDISWKFFYYDPNYECKKAYAEGKQIQLFNPDTGDWIDSDEPEWLDILKYRIKPEEPDVESVSEPKHKGVRIEIENEKHLCLYLYRQNDVVDAITHALYYTANPNSDMCIPNCAYENAEKVFDEWVNDKRFKKAVETLNKEE